MFYQLKILLVQKEQLYSEEDILHKNFKANEKLTATWDKIFQWRQITGKPKTWKKKMARQFLWESTALKNTGSLESHAHVQGKTPTQRKPEKTTDSSLGSAQKKREL